MVRLGGCTRVACRIFSAGMICCLLVVSTLCCLLLILYGPRGFCVCAIAGRHCSAPLLDRFAHYINN